MFNRANSRDADQTPYNARCLCLPEPVFCHAALRPDMAQRVQTVEGQKRYDSRSSDDIVDLSPPPKTSNSNVMKHPANFSLHRAVAAATIILALPSIAQETRLETAKANDKITENQAVTAEGTISSLNEEKIQVTTGTSPEPLRFTYSKGTEYVDELGVPVSVTSLKLGVPVTIHYAAVGDTMVANKIVVKRTSAVPNAISDTTLVMATGTISEFGAERMVVSTSTSSEPFSYSVSKKTTFVDEAGRVVSTETVKSGVPVTVYYTKTGDKFIASKVIVRKVGSTPGGITGTTATTTMGSISELTPEMLAIRTETAREPVRYKFTKSTTYVDESGAPVALEVLKTGLPVTVHYATSGDSRVATKVVVRKKTESVTPR
jgi:uncharacterized membrane protein